MAGILIDAGPLIAVLFRGDDYHIAVAPLFRELNCPFITTLPVITEAMYFLHAYAGNTGQAALWKMIHRGDLVLHHPDAHDLERMDELMRKYADLPMDFADASLVAMAEKLGLDRVFTLDRADFSVYRLHGKRSFSIVGPPLRAVA